MHEPSHVPPAGDPQRPDPRTAELIAADRRYLWHPFTPMKPWCENKEIVVIERGEAEFLIDTQGRRYIDGVSSLWCNVHGHNVPAINAAIIAQLNKIAHTTLLGLANVPSIRLGQRLVELAAKNGMSALTKVFYSDNGSTAVEVACKMAYQYWRNRANDPALTTRSRFIAFQNAYHGDTIGAVSLGGIPLFHETFKGLCFPADLVEAPAADGDTSLAQVETLLRQNAGAYAAVIIEPLVLGAGGMLMHTPRFLQRLRSLASQYDTLLIADEVLTGFGRTGTLFACQQAAITPDLLCLSKGLTAGTMPLGVTLATQHIFDAFYVDPAAPDAIHKTFFHGHTYTGHPLACAAALASLDLVDSSRLMDHVQSLMPILANMLSRAGTIPGGEFVHETRQCGLIAAIDLAMPVSRAHGKDGHLNRTHEPFPYTWRIGGELCTRMRSHGVMLRPLADTLVIMPPLAITSTHLHRLCDVVLQSLAWLPEMVQRRQNSSRT